jgi:hypothetical protein
MAGVSSRVLNGGNVIGLWTVDDSITTPTVGTTYAYKLSGNIISTSVERQDTGAYNITVEHVEDDTALQTFIAASVTVGATTEALTFEDGTQEGASGANTKYIAAVRGGLKGGASGAARKVGVFPVRMLSTSGGWSQSGDTYNRVNLEFEGYKLEKAVTLASTYFTDFMTTPAAVTLTTSLPYGTVVFA